MPQALLEPLLQQHLYQANPWWHNAPMPLLPPFQRWAFEPAIHRLTSGMAPIVALRGPRQVGKTTLLQQMIQHFLGKGIPATHILRVQFEDLPTFTTLPEPLLSIAYWFEQQILGKTFNTAAREGLPAYLCFDELQNLSHWATQLKYLVDLHSVRVIITGSSALQIEKGRDSLAGRLSTIEMGPLFLREIAALRGWGEIPAFLPVNGLSQLKQQSFWEHLREFGQQHQTIRQASFAAFSERGAYPVAHLYADRPWEELADQLNETIIRRVIQHDLPSHQPGLQCDELLLEEVFRLSCRYAGQVSTPALLVAEINRTLHANLRGPEILTYLQALAETLLLRLIEPLELRLKRGRGAAKLCLCDHALRASWLQEVIPLTPAGLSQHPHLSVLAGHLAESTVGYFLSSLLGLEVAHFPARGEEPEIDFVGIVGEQRIPIEVKYRKTIAGTDIQGLRSFLERPVYNAPFGLLITQTDSMTVDDPRIVPIPLSSLLLMR